MLTNHANPKVSYLSRLLVLPLLSLLLLAFTIRYKQQAPPARPASDAPLAARDTVPTYKGKVIQKVDVLKRGNDQKIHLFFTDGSDLYITPEEAAKDNLIKVKEGALATTSDSARKPEKAKSEFKGIYVLEGKILRQLPPDITPDRIESINVLKGKMAEEKYGEQGKEGVIIIELKENGTARVAVPATGNKREAAVEVPSATESNPGPVFQQAEEPASFPGGTKAYREFLSSHLQPFIVKAAKNGAPSGQHTVQVRFQVNKDGSIEHIRALTQIGYGLEEAAVSMMLKSPKWIPARQNKQPVTSEHQIPVTFVIAEQ